jgi:hypothetical protein
MFSALDGRFSALDGCCTIGPPEWDLTCYTAKCAAEHADDRAEASLRVACLRGDRGPVRGIGHRPPDAGRSCLNGVTSNDHRAGEPTEISHVGSFTERHSDNPGLAEVLRADFNTLT